MGASKWLNRKCLQNSHDVKTIYTRIISFLYELLLMKFHIKEIN